MAKPAKPRIVFHVAAGDRMGLGHLARSSGVAAALAKAGHSVAVVLEAPRDYPELTAAFPVAPSIVPNREAAAEALGRLAESARRVLLVTDMMGLDGTDSARARAQGYGALVHLADDGEAAYGADLQVDTDIVPSIPERPGRALLSGAAYHVLRPSVVERRPEAPWRASSVRRVLIALGGADPGRCTEMLLASLAGLVSADGDDGIGPVTPTVVLGPAMEKDRRCALSSDYPKLVKDGRGLDLVGAILSHDLIVTLGGLSTYEAMALGRPVACVSWSYMRGYVEKLADAGLVINLGSAETAASVLIRYLAENERLQELAARGWRTMDGRGGKRVAEAIVNLAQAAT